MNLLNTNHKLILAPLLLILFSNFLHLSSFLSVTPYYYYFLPEPNFWGVWINVPIFLEFLVPILGVGILFLASSNKFRKIEFALIPILIFYAYIFPWWIFQYPGDILHWLPNFVCFGLLFYGTYLLITSEQGRDGEITKEKKEYKPSDEISDKEFIPTLLLCLFVGMLGVHRFYVGKIGTGVAMIFTLGGLGIWVLVDFILICIGSFRDTDGRIIKYQRAVIATSSSETGIAEELEKFSVLKDKGIISEEEFNKKKEELLE